MTAGRLTGRPSEYLGILDPASALNVDLAAWGVLLRHDARSHLRRDQLLAQMIAIYVGRVTSATKESPADLSDLFTFDDDGGEEMPPQDGVDFRAVGEPVPVAPPCAEGECEAREPGQVCSRCGGFMTGYGFVSRPSPRIIGGADFNDPNVV